MFFKAIEITVGVVQAITIFDASGRDQAIDRFARCDAKVAQMAIVAGALDCQGWRDQTDQGKVLQGLPRLLELGIILLPQNLLHLLSFCQLIDQLV